MSCLKHWSSTRQHGGNGSRFPKGGLAIRRRRASVQHNLMLLSVVLLAILSEPLLKNSWRTSFLAWNFYDVIVPQRMLGRWRAVSCEHKPVAGLRQSSSTRQHGITSSLFNKEPAAIRCSKECVQNNQTLLSVYFFYGVEFPWRHSPRANNHGWRIQLLWGYDCDRIEELVVN